MGSNPKLCSSTCKLCIITEKSCTKHITAPCLLTHHIVQKVARVVRLCSGKMIAIEFRSAVLRFGPACRNVMHSLIVLIQRPILNILLEYDNVRFKQWQLGSNFLTQAIFMLTLFTPVYLYIKECNSSTFNLFLIFSN